MQWVGVFAYACSCATIPPAIASNVCCSRGMLIRKTCNEVDSELRASLHKLEHLTRFTASHVDAQKHKSPHEAMKDAREVVLIRLAGDCYHSVDVG